MEHLDLLISEEVLRDGQQDYRGVSFNQPEMLELAHAIASIGPAIFNIDIMPAMHEMHADVASQLIREGIPITQATRMHADDISGCLTRGNRVITISSVSEELMHAKGLTAEKNLSSTLREITAATNYGASTRQVEVGLALEDASRADLGFLKNYIQATSQLVDYFVYCDTNGIATPSETGSIISELVIDTGAKILMHCHNDSGLAVENTIEGILSGAAGISTVLTGIGERAAGNAPTEEVLEALKERGYLVNDVDYDRLHAVTDLVKMYTGGLKPADKGVQIHSSGMHVHGVRSGLKRGVEVYGSEKTYGAARPIEVTLTVASARSTLQEITAATGIDIAEQDVPAILTGLKNLALMRRQGITPTQAAEIIQTGQYLAHQDWRTIPALTRPRLLTPNQPRPYRPK
ncbi:hypothetical protein HN587_02865 [Candidatus Woesearchaeota archaeon]|jgi:benzylmalate synthase|nr:hypothetical protein [Candidatus Woesearchaeota archaeon]